MKNTPNLASTLALACVCFLRSGTGAAGETPPYLRVLDHQPATIRAAVSMMRPGSTLRDLPGDRKPLPVYVFAETSIKTVTKDESKKLEKDLKEALKRATAATKSFKKELIRLHGKKSEDWPPGERNRLLEAAQVQVDAQQELDAFRAEEGLNDSTRRLKGSLKGKDYVQLVETPDAAVVSLQILKCWATEPRDPSPISPHWVKVRISLCRTLSPEELRDLSPLEWVGRSRRGLAVKTRAPVVHAYTEEEPYWDAEYFGGIAWRNATRHMAGCVNKFFEENYAILSGLMLTGQPRDTSQTVGR
jgi:hypothetical protein